MNKLCSIYITDIEMKGINDGYFNNVVGYYNSNFEIRYKVYTVKVYLNNV